MESNVIFFLICMVGEINKVEKEKLFILFWKIVLLLGIYVIGFVREFYFNKELICEIVVFFREIVIYSLWDYMFFLGWSDWFSV